MIIIHAGKILFYLMENHTRCENQDIHTNKKAKYSHVSIDGRRGKTGKKK
jgi:hypothetical protein